MGKKVVMARTGAVLVLFVLGHMAGNLKAFQGPEAFNGYAEALREGGYPFLPRTGALRIVRLVLLAAAGFHVWVAYRLHRTSRAAGAWATGSAIRWPSATPRGPCGGEA